MEINDLIKIAKTIGFVVSLLANVYFMFNKVEYDDLFYENEQNKFLNERLNHRIDSIKYIHEIKIAKIDSVYKSNLDSALKTGEKIDTLFVEIDNIISYEKDTNINSVINKINNL